MKKGFTLIELLIVTGIMGFLATASIGGYYAMSRGMKDRGALSIAQGLMDQAMQRAEIDRTVTVVKRFDQLMKAAEGDDPPVVAGVALAIRPVGRVTDVDGEMIVDEFGDIESIYTAVDKENQNPDEEQNGATISLWKITDGAIEEVVVYEGIYPCPEDNADFYFTDPQTGSQAASAAGGAAANGSDASDTENSIPRYAFKRKSGATLQPGDIYGVEFARVQLPHGYTFGQTMPSSMSQPVQDCGTVFFGTDYLKKGGATGESGQDASGSARSVKVYALRPGLAQPVEIGSTSDAEEQVK